MLRQPPDAYDQEQLLLKPTLASADYLSNANRSANSDEHQKQRQGASVPIRPSAVRRILIAAMGMTDEVYDTFQIRAVAHAAYLSPSTLYRHFRSKDELLVACLEVWLTEVIRVVRAELTNIADPVQRIRHVSTRVTVGLTERPLLAHAFVRSYLLTNSTALEFDFMRARLSSLFVFAAGDNHDGRNEIAELITDIWAVNLPALVQRRITLVELEARLERSVFAAGLRPSRQRRDAEETRPA